jgi:competence ComEA-like helix-hairpin-helix protein
MAGRIIRYREENGNFRQPEDIMKVAGIGKAMFEKID